MERGKLRHRIAFERRVSVPDGFGNETQSFQAQFTVWGGIKFRNGGEDVYAARLQARRPAILTVRNLPQTRLITAGWRARWDGWIFDLREDPSETDDAVWLEVLAEGQKRSG